MRTLTSTLVAKQEGAELTPFVHLLLNYGASIENLYKDRVQEIEQEDSPQRHTITIYLDNHDGYFNYKSYDGWNALLACGAETSVGNESSNIGLLKVMSHRFTSAPDNLQLVLVCEGSQQLLQEDRANAHYLPEPENETTLKEYFNQIAGATLACFSHCQPYTVVWESEDTIIGTYKPKDAFRIYKGQSRMSLLRSIIDYTGCVVRYSTTTVREIRVFVPTTTGTTYDSEYSFETAGQTMHPFFAKGWSEKIAVPNRIVVESEPDEDGIIAFRGEYIHHASYDKVPISQFQTAALESNEQGANIAEAIEKKFVMGMDGGSVTLPIMNFGTELYDYVRVVDQRQGDIRVGNIGKVIRRIKLSENVYSMTVSFGSWLSVRQTMNNLSDYSNGMSVDGTYFARLRVKDLVAENIRATNLDFVWIDPEGNIDLSKIGDNLDSLPDGTVYARIKSMHLDAGVFQMDEAVFFKAGFDPRDKFDLGNNDFDDIPEGATYKRVLSTQVNAGRIMLSDQTEYAVGYDPSTKKRTFTAQPTTPYAVGDMWVDGTTFQRCTFARVSGAFQSSDWQATTLDAIANGYSYKRTASAALSPSGLVLLDAVEVGNLWGLSLKSDFTAGKLRLSSTYQDASNRAVSDYEKNYWTAKPNSMEDIPNGYTYAKVRSTSLSDGRIVLSQTIKSGTWYNEHGVIIDASYGLAVYGYDMAFATFASYNDRIYGIYQCKVASDGSIVAAGGGVKLNSGGITLSAYHVMCFKYGSTSVGYISADYTGLILDGYNRIWLAPQGGAGEVFIRSSDASPAGVLNANQAKAVLLPAYAWASATRYNICIDYDGSLYVCRPDTGTWRHIS